MGHLLGFFRIGDRAILNYIKNGSSQSMIIQIIDIERISNSIEYVVKAPLNIIRNIFGNVYLDREKYGVPDGWGVIKVSPTSLTPCGKPHLKVIK